MLGDGSTEKAAIVNLQKQFTTARRRVSLLSKGNLGGAPKQSNRMHPLHYSDPPVFHIKLISFRNSFSRIMVGQNFWGNLGEQVSGVNSYICSCS